MTALGTLTSSQIFMIRRSPVGIRLSPMLRSSSHSVSTWNGTSGPTPIPLGTQTYGGAPLVGTGYTASLWGGVAGTDTEGTLRLVATAPFRVTTSQSLYGFWQAPSAAQVVPGVASDP